MVDIKKLSSTLRNTKTRTLVLMFGVGILLVGAIILFRIGTAPDPLDEQASKTVSIPQKIRAIPGNELPEQYAALQREDNIRRAQEAKKQQTSAISTIIGSVSESQLDKDALARQRQAAGAEDDLFGDTSRGGFVGEGLYNPSSATKNADKEREDRLKAQRDRLDKLKADKARAKEMERLRRLADRQRKEYLQSIQKTAQSMQRHAQAVFSGWSEFEVQDYVQGTLALSDARGNGTLPGTLSVDPNTGQVVEIKGDGQSDDKNDSGKKRFYIKAGTVLFGVLDTAINTDEPGPVLATIVHGKYKGGKLIGAIEHPDYAEKVLVSFQTLSLPKHETSLSVKVVAIDPDTARTALATDVDHHYLLRYGSLFASAFLEGYGKAINQQGTTTTTPNGTTTETKPELSGEDQLYAAFGTVGERWGQQLQPIFDTPYTVKVDQGVGVGLLFLNDADVTIE